MTQQAKDYITALAAVAQQKEKERGIIINQNLGTATQQTKTTINQVTIEQAKRFDDTFKRVLDYTFATLREIKPAWRNAFKSKAEAVGYKTQLGLAMQKANINTIEKVNAGLDYARLEKGAFMPSTGDFVNWCKDAYELQLQKHEDEKRRKRITDQNRLLSSDTWEERQKTARAALDEIKASLKTAK